METMDDSAAPAEAGQGGRRVVVRVDGSTRMGGGHVMRCLSLADALAAGGARVAFVSALLPDFLADLIRASGHDLHRIEPTEALRAEGEDWDSALLPTEAQVQDAGRTIAAAGEADWIVLDHYRLDARWAESLPSRARRLVIDDLANRRQACDLLVDQTFGRSVRDYLPFTGDHTKILAGARFAMLRPEFPAARAAALGRRETPAAPSRLLVSLGQTDVGGVTREVLESVLERLGPIDVDVVLGPTAGSRSWVEALAVANPRVTLHIGSRDMAGLIARADIAIGAAGTSAWERCCLGLPTVTLVLADNQRLVAGNLERAGAIIVAPDASRTGECLARLCEDERLRMGMIAAAAAITDGHGSALVADAMFEPVDRQSVRIEVRPAAAADSRAAWLWRNDPATRAASQTHEPVPWPDHAAWWARALTSPDREMLIAERDGEAIAVVRFDRLGAPYDGFEVSINLKPDARGGGLGQDVLKAACDHFTRHAGAVPLVATIHQENLASRRVFEQIGFVRERRVGEAGFERYLRPGGA
jgi:UDP-2,4-diacetamido-2,4,6-trideoxy-beta-L-altropyranose hydrolase